MRERQRRCGEEETGRAAERRWRCERRTRKTGKERVCVWVGGVREPEEERFTLNLWEKERKRPRERRGKERQREFNPIQKVPPTCNKTHSHQDYTHKHTHTYSLLRKSCITTISCLVYRHFIQLVLCCANKKNLSRLSLAMQHMCKWLQARLSFGSLLLFTGSCAIRKWIKNDV